MQATTNANDYFIDKLAKKTSHQTWAGSCDDSAK
jgi:hypothetical protein